MRLLGYVGVTSLTWLLSSLSWSVHAFQTLDLRLTVDEEKPPGTIIAEMMSLFDLEESDERTFKILKQQFKNPHTPFPVRDEPITVDQETGLVTLTRPIDRESECRAEQACILNVQVVILPQEVFSILNLDIIINDINDNAPEFGFDVIVVNVSESAHIGDVFSLDQYQALDLDAGKNSNITYSLPYNDLFEVRQDASGPGRSRLQLVLLNKLDYEKRQLRHFSLIATDGGFPVLSSRVPIRVHVLDSNDNVPVFEKEVYVINLLENLEAGTDICHVRASDVDTGRNRKIQYFLVQDAGSATSIHDEFLRVNPESGVVTLQQKLDKERHDGLKVHIEARDGGSPALSSQTLLILHVEDVNDNNPSLSIRFIVESNENKAYILESTSIGTYIAIVSASDADHDKNGEVLISLRTIKPGAQDQNPLEDSGHFLLASNGLIRTSKPFDRETENKFKVVISACDMGTPSRCILHNISVEILDENDNQPTFLQSIYEVTLSESDEIGTYVTTVSARDDDTTNAPAYMLFKKEIVPSTNGMIRYLIQDELHAFSVNSESGRVTLLRPLDREARSTWETRVIAKDMGKPKSLNGTCLLRVKVTDINDNPPLFTNPALNNSIIYASILRNESITNIQTVDYDSGKSSKIKLKLLMVDGSSLDRATDESFSNFNFILDSQSGNLKLNLSNPNLQNLVGEHHLVVEATDSGHPPLSSTTHIIIRVVDTLILPSPPLEEEDIPSDQYFASPILSTIISLSVSSLILVIVIPLIVIKCRKNNKKERTYNCRAEENAKNRRFDEYDASSSRGDGIDGITKSINDRNVEYHVVEDDHVLHNSSQKSGKYQLSSESDHIKSEFNALHTGTSASIVVPCNDDYANYQVITSIEEILTSNYEEKTFQAPSIYVSSLHRSIPTHTDGDSGRGDSEPDNGSFSGSNERGIFLESEKQHKRHCNEFFQPPPPTFDTIDQYTQLGSYCTEACRLIGHSDTCWMPPARDNPTNQSTFGFDNGRILETIDESSTSNHHESAKREKVLQAPCFIQSANLKKDYHLHEDEEYKRINGINKDEFRKRRDIIPEEYNCPQSDLGNTGLNFPPNKYYDATVI